jgi:carboxyl-terminal processing protease
LAAAALNDAAQQTELWLAAFEQAWTTIRDKHFDRNLGGLDWEDLGKQTREAVARAENEAAARRAVSKMLERLGHSHVGVIEREAYERIGARRGAATLGLELRLLEGKVVVWRVKPGSAAAEAGVKAGWILETPKPLRGEFLPDVLYANSLVHGAEGEERELSFQPGGKMRLGFRKAPGRMAVFGNLPPVPVEMEFRKLGEIGYFAVSAWFEPEWLQTEMAQAMAACRSCKGFVVDLRGNFGGLGILSAAMLGWFVEDSVAIGTLSFRDYQLKLMANPRPEGFRGKLAVLVDGLSLSTSEFFAGGVQDLGRGKIFGEKTPGMALPSAIERLPTGDALQYPMANYVSAGGKALEGRGVTPDFPTPLTQADLLAGEDAALEAAMKWIRE